MLSGELGLHPDLLEVCKNLLIIQGSVQRRHEKRKTERLVRSYALGVLEYGTRHSNVFDE